tara:strand:+ start:959 stop:2005 length:1047 start_codon:yes stop_codon:yes gene_type:complete
METMTDEPDVPAEAPPPAAESSWAALASLLLGCLGCLALGMAVMLQWYLPKKANITEGKNGQFHLDTTGKAPAPASPLVPDPSGRMNQAQTDLEEQKTALRRKAYFTPRVFRASNIAAGLGIAGFLLGLYHLFKKRGRRGLASMGTLLSGVAALALLLSGMSLYTMEVEKPRQMLRKVEKVETQAKSLIVDFKKIYQQAGINLDNPTNPLLDLDWKGEAAPNLTAKSTYDYIYRLNEESDKRVFLVFLRLNDHMSHASLPALKQFWANRAEYQNFLLLAVMNENLADIKKYREENGITFPLTKAGPLEEPYSAIGVFPTVFIIDRTLIQQILFGPVDFNRLDAAARAP